MLPGVLKEFADMNGLQSDPIQIWGHYRGYLFTLGFYKQNNALTVFSAICFSDPGVYSTLDAFFTEMEKEKRINSYKLTHGSITLTKNALLSAVKTHDLQLLLDQITEKYQELGASPSCYNCNKAGEMGFSRYNGVVLPLCDECFEGVRNRISQNQQAHESTANNYLAGTIGAVVGGLLGSVLWVIIGMLGYVASIAGFAISFASAKGYTLLKGKITRAALWIIGLSSLFALIIAQFVTYGLAFYRTAGTFTLPEALGITLRLLFISSELGGEFLKNTLIGLVFAGLGAIGTFKNLVDVAAKPAGSIERV